MKNFPKSRLGLCVIAAALAMVTVAVPSPARADDPAAERRAVQQQKKIIDAEVSKLRKTDAQLKSEIANLDASVKASKALYDAAANAAANAKSAAELARGSEAATTANYNRLRNTTKELALDLYMGGFEDRQVPALSPDKLAKAAAHGYLNVRAVSRGQDITKRLGDLRDQMVKARQAAEAAEAAAAAERAKQASALTSLQGARAKQTSARSQLADRLERMLAESAHLASRDRTLAKEIARRAGGGGTGSGRIAVGNVATTTVQGIRVATSIAANVDKLLTKAKADGVPLAGWGYRDSQQQIELRKKHCGTSQYDIYEKPASQCNPPTARPGASMHERGLAIDFTYNGSVITSKSSPAFKWLAANAKGYGLYNLPSEPWHWSTNGN